MSKFTCIIVDDEPLAIELLQNRLSILNKNIEVIGTYTSWTNALEALRSIECDILFLDISMKGKNGMDLLKFIPNIHSEVIFITAHADYALNAFKLSASGYILKPIDDAELASAVDKALDRVQNKKLAKKGDASFVNTKIGIPNNKVIEYINLSEIIYLEATNSYTKVVTKDTEILSSYYLGKFKWLLEQPIFYQVHRSYIVNLNYVRRYEPSGVIVMINNVEIPISRNVREDFLKLFNRVSGLI